MDYVILMLILYSTHLEELEKKKNRYAEEEKIFLEGRKASKIVYSIIIYLE